jgi:hypothetical protein
MTDLKQLADRVLSLEKRVTRLEERHGEDAVQPALKGGKDLSVKEFIIAKRPSNDVEKTLAIGYFLEKFAGMASFNVDDLGRHFQLAKEASPTNINDKVNMNINKGHMAEAREKKDRKKAWMLTNSGEKFLERGFKDKEK